jgi:hypothetical protein
MDDSSKRLKKVRDHYRGRALNYRTTTGVPIEAPEEHQKFEKIF